MEQAVLVDKKRLLRPVRIPGFFLPMELASVVEMISSGDARWISLGDSAGKIFEMFAHRLIGFEMLDGTEISVGIPGFPIAIHLVIDKRDDPLRLPIFI